MNNKTNIFHRTLARLAVLVTVAAVGLGCQRVALDCSYTLVPHVQTYSGGVGNTPSDWTAYAFYGTTERLRVPSTFDSVIMGQVIDRKTGEGVLCNVQAMQNDSGNIVLQLHATDAIIVVCAPEYEVFAWKQATITENLWYLEIPIWLRIWRGADYKESWQFVFPKSEE